MQLKYIVRPSAMFKSYIFILLLFLAVAIAAPFFIPGPNGTSLLTVEDLKWPDLRTPDLHVAHDLVHRVYHMLPQWPGPIDLPEISLVNLLPASDNSEPTPTSPRPFYKWVDRDGVVNFSTRRPDGEVVQTIYLPDTLPPDHPKRIQYL
ncbi:MAG: DUF4124 domain-containing protein, partial [Desulfobacteraceae bacterium]